jgi:general secretion pathway protein F
MPNFRYRALTQGGDLVNGALFAPSAAEVSRRIEFLGLVPIETVEDDAVSAATSSTRALFNRPRREDVTIFTRDLALLLKAGVRLDEALELLTNDADIGRLRSTVSKIRADLMAGETFAESIARHPLLFPAIYIALVRVGETSGKLAHILELLANERTRAELLRRKLIEALQYPAFILLAAACVLLFFIVFVLPQFSAVLRDFGAKSDSTISIALDLSEFLRGHVLEITAGLSIAILSSAFLLRRSEVRAMLIGQFSRLPGMAAIFGFFRASLFCRNLGILLGSDVTLTATLRILVDIMAATGPGAPWMATADRVRHGGKLSDALAAIGILPAMAVRMLRIGEETGQLPTLAARVAEFYEAKLQRSLDRIVGVVGPLAVISIGLVVGGLIVSVMTALLSITQVVG